jgi:hypothetical protein
MAETSRGFVMPTKDRKGGYRQANPMRRLVTGERFVDKSTASRAGLSYPGSGPGSAWVLVPLAITGGMLVGLSFKCLRQRAARFLLPGRVAYDLAVLVTPKLPDEPRVTPIVNRDSPQ